MSFWLGGFSFPEERKNKITSLIEISLLVNMWISEKYCTYVYILFKEDILTGLNRVVKGDVNAYLIEYTGIYLTRKITAHQKRSVTPDLLAGNKK